MTLDVQIREFTIKENTPYGQVEKRVDMDRVFVNGLHAGYLPHKTDDPFFGVFHPLSGFPPEMCPAVVDGHERVCGHLQAPQPSTRPISSGELE